MEKKVCSKCGLEKSVNEFYKKGNGFEGMCKACRNYQNKNRYTYICESCGEEFKTGKKNQKTCSKTCSATIKYPKIYVECEICKKKVKKIQRDIKRNKHHYCSNKCRAIAVGRSQVGKNNPNYKNATIEVNCSNCNKKFKILKCNTVNSDKAQKQNLYCSKKCKSEHQKEILKGESNPNYGNGRRIKGKLNPNYNFTKTYEERMKGRLYTDYYNWRNLIFEKYNYTCQCCNKQGGTLAAHHLDGYNKFKEKRTDVNNGVLLCANCHKEFHKIYGYGNNTLEQFKEFYKNKTNKKFEVVRV